VIPSLSVAVSLRSYNGVRLELGIPLPYKAVTDRTHSCSTSGLRVRHGDPLDMGRRCRMLRPPIGPLQWAGTESSPVQYGKMDGAVHSGERVAQEALTALS
jgi:hypothetical protein